MIYPTPPTPADARPFAPNYLTRIGMFEGMRRNNAVPIHQTLPQTPPSGHMHGWSGYPSTQLSPSTFEVSEPVDTGFPWFTVILGVAALAGLLYFLGKKE